MANQVLTDITPGSLPKMFRSPTGVYYYCVSGTKSGDTNKRVYIYSSTDKTVWTNTNFPNPDAGKPQQFGDMNFDSSGNPIVIIFGQQTTTVTNIWWSRWNGSSWTSITKVYSQSYNQTNASFFKAGNTLCMGYVQNDSSSNTTIKMLFFSLSTYTWTTSPVSVSATTYEYFITGYYDGTYYHSISLGYDASYNFQVFHRKTTTPSSTWPARTQVTSGAYQWNNVSVCKYGTSGLFLMTNRTDATYGSKYVYYYWTYNGSTWTSRGTVNAESYHTNGILGVINFSDTDIRCVTYGNTATYPSIQVLKLSKWNGSSWNGWEIKDDSLTAYNRQGGNLVQEDTYITYPIRYFSTPNTLYVSNTRVGQLVAREVTSYLNATNTTKDKIQDAIKSMTAFANTVNDTLNKIIEKSVTKDTYLNGLYTGLQKSAGTEASVYSNSTNTNINKAINSNKNSNVYMAKAFVNATINVLADNVKTVTTYMENCTADGNIQVEVLSEVYANNVKVSSSKSINADKLASVYMSKVSNYVDKMNYKHMESTVFSEIANISIKSYKLAELTINSYMNAVKTELEKTQVRTSEVDTFMNQLATEMEYQRVFGRIVTAYANESNLSLDIQIPGLNTNISTSSTGNTASITLHPDNNNVILNVGQSKLIVDDKVNNANVSATSNKIIISVKEEN